MKKISSIFLITLLFCACSDSNPDTLPDSTSAKPQPVEPMVDAANSKSPETLIPRSMPGDKGKYYLLEKSRSGAIVSATHKRVGLDSVGFTKTETNCSTMQMREIGYSEISSTAIENQPTDWFDLVEGSSKADLAAYVCKQ